LEGHVASCPIPVETLSATVQKSVGEKAPPPVRMMAARGMAPMAPKDLVTAQFVLTFDADQKVRDAATKSLAGLDERIANAVLSDTTLNPHVLGHLAIALAAKDAFAEKLLLNPSTPVSAFVEVAKVGSENICEIIANNQARLLDEPEIARSLTKNSNALKSTLDRVIDFLVRSSVVLEGVPEFEQALLRLTGEERVKAADKVQLDLDMIDAQFLTPEQKAQLQAQGRRIIEDEGEEPAEPSEDEKLSIEQRLRGKKIGELVAIATKGRREYRRYLLRHANPIVALAAITSPATREMEVVAAANSRMVHQDVINHIAKEKEWTRLYSVKLALAQNPKTLLPTAMKFVPLLHKRDIRIISKSKNVQMGVRNLAMKLAKEGD
jgi:hypothetical protein